MRTPDDILTEEALFALGEACQIPRGLEEEILAALDRGEGGGAIAAEPSSGVFRARGEATVRLALSELEGECQIPDALADQILDSVLGEDRVTVSATDTLGDDRLAPSETGTLGLAPPAPVITPAFDRREPLREVIAGHRKEGAWARKLGAIAIAAGVALGIVSNGAPAAREQAQAPVSLNATEMREGDPQLDDVRFVVTGMLRAAAYECGAEIAGGLVWFERSGVVSVFDLSGSRVSSRVADPGCVERVGKHFRIPASDHSILVQLAPEDGSGAPAWPEGTNRRGVRLTTWRVDET